MCFSNCTAVAESKAPMATAIQSRAGASKNEAEPQVKQNPRRTLADDAHHETLSCPVVAICVWVQRRALRTPAVCSRFANARVWLPSPSAADWLALAGQVPVCA